MSDDVAKPTLEGLAWELALACRDSSISPNYLEVWSKDILAALRAAQNAARREERERCSGHYQMQTDTRCFECGDPWPCSTVLRIREDR